MASSRAGSRVLRLSVLAVVAIAVVVGAAFSIKVVPNDQAAEVTGTKFNAAEYVEKRWQSDLRPAILENATELTTILDGLAGPDAEATRTQYGNSPGPSSAYAFAIRGTAVAGELNGTVVPLEVEGAPSDMQIVLQVGPAINGTALRDATGMVSFGDFLNQLEFQNVAGALNDEVKSDPLGSIDRTALAGKTVEFVGAFGETSTGLVSIVPVTLVVS